MDVTADDSIDLLGLGMLGLGRIETRASSACSSAASMAANSLLETPWFG